MKRTGALAPHGSLVMLMLMLLTPLMESSNMIWLVGLRHQTVGFSPPLALPPLSRSFVSDLAAGLV